jgi:LuxR family maltose regulon positive regulatory protein
MITAQQVHEEVVFLLDHLPPPMHLIIASRADPPWSLARLRARGEISELRATDLRFTPEEAVAFLNTAMGLDLSPEDVTALEERTEGWIVGLQMAAISVQGRRQAPGSDVSAFIQAFTGSNRFVLDYLVEEVLAQQTPAIQEFLLKTSILEQMTASLCDAVLGKGAGEWGGGGESTPAPLLLNSSALLEYLEKANLFVVPLDDERRWYRYHLLFADLLRSRLEQIQPDHAELHLRASAWLEEKGFIAEALRHALGAADFGRAARLAETHALTMLGQGHLGTLAGWLEALPEEMALSRPWLCVAHAWIALYAGKLDAVDRWLTRAEAGIVGEGTPSTGLRPEAQPEGAAAQRSALSEAESRHVAGHIAAIRSYEVGLRGKLHLAPEYASRALENLPEDDWMARGFAATTLAIEMRRSGRLGEAEEAFAKAIAIAEAGGINHVAMLARSNLAGLRLAQGRLREAEALYWSVIRANVIGGKPLPIAGLAYTALSRLCRERNELETALHYTRQGIEISGQWGQAEFLLTAYIDLADVLLAMGDARSAFQNMDLAKQSCGEMPWPPWLAAHEAEMHLRAGDLEAAVHWAQEAGLSAEGPSSFYELTTYLPLVRVRIAQRRWAEAHRLLVRLLEISEAAGAVRPIIQILVLQAIVFHGEDKLDQALPVLKRALLLAEPERFVRVFVDAGAPMADLLRMAESGLRTEGETHLHSYVRTLLAALASETKDEGRMTQKPISSFVPGPSSLAEPLTEREREVLRLLTTGLSSTEIAQELVVSVNTVRSHIKSIYGKLNVHGRLAAVQRAKELGLL